MKKTTKILVIIASIAMISAYFFPIWQIDLEAPQYPEGLGLKIWVNKITGDLQTINGLNHYIGMKTIEPDSIKELKIMPYVLGVLIFLGILAGIIGKRKVFITWVILLVISGIAGGVDFYLWEYDYGHNLDPNAAIKVPGMTYQPPLIGSKQLLNFVAHSYPDKGGYAIIGAGLLAIVLLFCEYKCNKIKHKASEPKKDVSVIEVSNNNAKDEIAENKSFNTNNIHTVAAILQH